MERIAKVRRIRVPVEWQAVVLQGVEGQWVVRGSASGWVARGVAVCLAIGVVTLLVPGF